MVSHKALRLSFIALLCILTGTVLYSLSTPLLIIATSPQLQSFLHYEAPAPPLPDPRIKLPALVHPLVKHGVYPNLFSPQNFTSQSLNNGTCPRYNVNIEPNAAANKTLTGAVVNVAARQNNGSGTIGTQQEDEEGCVRLQFSTSRTLPLVALASSPGSGNTWTRHLLQQLTGLYTGAVYMDPSLRDGGFLGEGRVDNSVVVIKTHGPWNCTAKLPGQPCPKYQKAILVVRDPHEAILAEFNRFHSRGLHKGVAPATLFNTTTWFDGALSIARQWYQTIESWTRFQNHADQDGCLLVVSYRRLQENMREELTSIGRFLGVNETYLQGKHMDCVVDHSMGAFKRKHTKKPSMVIYTKEMNSTIAMYTERVNLILTYLNAGFAV